MICWTVNIYDINKKTLHIFNFFRNLIVRDTHRSPITHIKIVCKAHPDRLRQISATLYVSVWYKALHWATSPSILDPNEPLRQSSRRGKEKTGIVRSKLFCLLLLTSFYFQFLLVTFQIYVHLWHKIDIIWNVISQVLWAHFWDKRSQWVRGRVLRKG